MKGERITVGTSKTLVVNGSHGSVTHEYAVLVKNPAGGQTVFLGGEDVNTTDKAFPLDPGETVAADVVNDVLYGIVAATTQNVYVLRREL